MAERSESAFLSGSFTVPAGPALPMVSGVDAMDMPYSQYNTAQSSITFKKVEHRHITIVRKIRNIKTPLKSSNNFSQHSVSS